MAMAWLAGELLSWVSGWLAGCWCRAGAAPARSSYPIFTCLAEHGHSAVLLAPKCKIASFSLVPLSYRKCKNMSSISARPP